MEAVSLYELNEYLRRVIALNFEAPIWVRCEISQIKNSRGHYYLDLVDKDADSDAVRARSGAVLWASTYRFLKRKIGSQLDNMLSDGVEVQIRIKVDFHEQYGLKLIIDDVDPAFTMGQVELRRREILLQLQRENILSKNSDIPLPVVAQRIAVLSSAGAAGYMDFIEHLRENPYGYQYSVDLYSVALQGMQVEQEVTDALLEINMVAEYYDCVVIIRGGGSRLDLAAFDSLEIGRAIANCPLPVITGIGHEIDQTVADAVAHAALKTPTAVADLLIEVNMHFEGVIQQTYDQLHQLARNKMQQYRQELETTSVALQYLPGQFLEEKSRRLDEITPRLNELSHGRVRHAKMQLSHISEMLEALDPKRILSRGFSITMKGGRIVRDASTLRGGDKLETTLAAGTVKSTVQ